MHRRLTRDEARRVLELPPSADAAARKAAYRRLARLHHPDLGGDPAAFHRLQAAYERLGGQAGDAEDAWSGVVPGRPSRPGGRPDPAPASVGSVDWSTLPASRPDRLTRDRVATWFAQTGGSGGLEATSRAPGSRLNRLAPSLAPDLTSTLTILPGSDDRGRDTVRVQLRAAPRRARRALDTAALSGSWTRTRSSSTTTLRTDVPPEPDARLTAVRLLDRLEPLLEELGWPLGAWTCLAPAR